MHCCSSLHFSSDPSLILLEASEAGAEDGASSVEVKNIAEENINYDYENNNFEKGFPDFQDYGYG